MKHFALVVIAATSCWSGCRTSGSANVAGISGGSSSSSSSSSCSDEDVTRLQDQLDAEKDQNDALAQWMQYDETRQPFDCQSAYQQNLAECRKTRNYPSSAGKNCNTYALTLFNHCSDRNEKFTNGEKLNTSADPSQALSVSNENLKQLSSQLAACNSKTKPSANLTQFKCNAVETMVNGQVTMYLYSAIPGRKLELYTTGSQWFEMKTANAGQSAWPFIRSGGADSAWHTYNKPVYIRLQKDDGSYLIGTTGPLNHQ